MIYSHFESDILIYGRSYGIFPLLPLGSLVGGFIAEGLGTRTTMGLAAFGFGFVGLYFALRPRLRRLPAMNDIDPDEFNVESLPAAKNSD